MKESNKTKDLAYGVFISCVAIALLLPDSVSKYPFYIKIPFLALFIGALGWALSKLWIKVPPKDKSKKY